MIGQRISNFHILEKIGSTPNGDIFKARHATLGIPVALKFIHPDKMADPETRKRFVHEAHAAATLDHQAICKVFDYEEFGNRAFIAMDFLEGNNLKDLIARGPVPIRDAVLMVIQAAEGLEQAHARGVVHRDIKPSNLMATPADDGGFQVKILDFGVSRTVDTTQLTQTGSVLGTSTYMSPEQVQGVKVDHRTDLWSLGAVLYELLTAKQAFPGDHHLAVQYAIVQNQVDPANRVRPEIPPELNAILVRALKKDREARYQTAREMLDDLRGFFRSGGDEWSPTRQWLWKYRNRLLMGAGGLVALALLAVILPRVIPRPVPVPNPFEHGRTRQLFHSESCESQPRLSPDGTRVLFTSDAVGNQDIMWVGVAGGDPVALTDHPADDCDPCWLPDGSGILFFSERKEGTGIWKMDLSGTAPRFLIRDGQFPSVSPDGSRVAFSRADTTGSGRIFVADLTDPARMTQLSGEGQGHWSHSYPAWSPDGKNVAYGTFHNIWEVSMVDGSARSLTDSGVADNRPVYSRDGRFVYFSSGRDGSFALWRVDRNTGDLVKMTPGSGPESHADLDRAGTLLAYSTEESNEDISIRTVGSGETSTLGGPSRDYMPHISPDGRLMVFVSSRWDRRGQLWVQDLDTGRPVGIPRRLLEQEGTASQPVLSPDGRWVAYYQILQETRERDLYISPIPSGPAVRITDHSDSETSPAWSPDGRWLAFATDRDAKQAIFIIPVQDGKATGPARRVTPPGLAANFPTWSPDGRFIAFQAVNGETIDTMVMPVDGSEPPRFLTENTGTYLARWVWGLDEIWISGKWGGYVNEIRRLDPVDGVSRPFEPPLFMDPDNEWPYFFPDRDGRFIVFTDYQTTGDIWLLEAEEGVRF